MHNVFRLSVLLFTHYVILSTFITFKNFGIMHARVFRILLLGLHEKIAYPFFSLFVRVNIKKVQRLPPPMCIGSIKDSARIQLSKRTRVQNLLTLYRSPGRSLTDSK